MCLCSSTMISVQAQCSFVPASTHPAVLMRNVFAKRLYTTVTISCGIRLKAATTPTQNSNPNPNRNRNPNPNQREACMVGVPGGGYYA